MEEVPALQQTIRELDGLLTRTLRDQLRLEALLETLPSTVGDLSAQTHELSETVALLRSLAPQTAAALLSLRTASRPQRLRSTIGACLLVLATLLGTLVTISTVWPGWTLPPSARRSLAVGALIQDNFAQLPRQDQAKLEELLTKLAALSSDNSPR